MPPDDIRSRLLPRLAETKYHQERWPRYRSHSLPRESRPSPVNSRLRWEWRCQDTSNLHCKRSIWRKAWLRTRGLCLACKERHSPSLDERGVSIPWVVVAVSAWVFPLVERRTVHLKTCLQSWNGQKYLGNEIWTLRSFHTLLILLLSRPEAKTHIMLTVPWATFFPILLQEALKSLFKILCFFLSKKILIEGSLNKATLHVINVKLQWSCSLLGCAWKFTY